MEGAFKLQLKADAGSQAEKFVLEKLEVLGKRKAALEKALSEKGESESNVISLDEVRQDLEDRVSKVTKGWAKLPAVQKRRALRCLIEKMFISPKGLDIYYYSCALPQEGMLGGGSGETENAAKILPWRARGTDSKLLVQNCTSARVATPAGFEPAAPCLEGRCSIQLSYGVVKFPNAFKNLLG